MNSTIPVAIVHDYLTQRGGAERVVLSMSKAFPEAPIYTSLYEPSGTFPAFQNLDIRVLPLNHVGMLRRHHRWAFPLLAPAFSRMRVEASVALCSSSGWAHGVRTGGSKVVYCHTPARWIYQTERYAGDSQMRKVVAVLGRPALRAWDVHAAGTARLYLANSRAVRDRIQRTYGREAYVLPPPCALDVRGPHRPVGVDPGFFLCVSRPLPYKNLRSVVDAFALLPDERLVLVGMAPPAPDITPQHNVQFFETINDDELRYLYASCKAVVAAAFEDYGLTPVEGATFGKPSVVLRWGGFLDTVVERETGIFFDAPDAESIAGAIRDAAQTSFDSDRILRHAEQYQEEHFISRLRELVLSH